MFCIPVGSVHFPMFMKITSLLAKTGILFLFLIGGESVKAQLTAGFSATPVSGCAPLLVNFTDASSGNPDQWEWDLGNGTISYFQHPSVTYFNPGTYTIRLTIKKGTASATVTKTQYITVHAAPAIDFTTSAIVGCFPLKVDFTDKSTAGSGTVATYLWDFGDGGVSTLQHPSHTYNAAGDYNISLHVTNSHGCSAGITRQNAISIHTGVKAGFTTGIGSCQAPASIPFTNTSTGTGTLTYNWDFGDGAQSTAIHPSHTYALPGQYTVRLTTNNNTGCSNTFTQTIQVGATAGFTAPAISCINENVLFTNTAAPAPVSVAWNFGDGATSTDPSPSHTYTAIGNYTITQVTTFANCQDTKTGTIQIIARPTVDFSAADTASCKAPFTAVFTSIAPGAVAWEWRFGDGGTSTQQNPSHTYTSEGSFPVTLTITNSAGCKETIVKNQFIEIRKPRVEIMNNPERGCVPYTFTPALLIESVTPIIDYQWNFGDGGTGTGLNPSHTYTQKGIYTVSVTYTTKDGCKETVSRTDLVKVGNKVTVDFSGTPRDVCASHPIHFTDLSIGNPPADNPIEEWWWQFGDGGTHTIKNPSHPYADTGNMSVSLTVWSNGCPSWLTKINYIHIRPPIARFEESLDCTQPYRRVFTNTSIVDRSATPLTWNWDFGDGSQATTENATHTYATPGEYNVTLTVTNGGCQYITSKKIFIVDNAMTFTASETAVCPGSPVRFDMTLSNTNNIISYSLYSDYGPNAYSNVTTITETYTKPGLYTISATVIDTNRCFKILNRQVRVISTQAGLDVPAGSCLNKQVTFADLSTGEPGFPIAKRVIDYGDGTPAETDPAAFTHTYTQVGDFTITFQVTNSKGCSDTVTKTISITDPKADFSSPDPVSCTGKNIAFVASGGAAYTYEWEFGDGQTATVANPAHHYNSEGTFSVVLHYKDQYGCTGTVSKLNYVKVGNPQAHFGISGNQSTCPPLIVTFSNASQNVESMTWDFGDGNTSTLADPVHFYTYPGEYWPRLIVKSKGGCADTLQDKKITINGPKGTFQYADVDGCLPVTVEFKGITTDNVTFIWDFNDGATATTTDPQITYTYNRPGSYLPRMILKDAQGCQVPIPGPDYIDVYGVSASFSTDKLSLCDRGFVQFNDQSVSNDLITGYSWMLGDGSVSTAKNFSHEYLAPGDYPVQLEVTTQHNCKHTIQSVTPVQVIASPRAGITGPAAACVPVNFQFNGQLLNANPYPLTWSWNFGNGQTAAVQNPPIAVFDKAGDYQVSLTVTNSFNCTSTATWPVSIHPLPVVDAGIDIVICRDQPRLLQATGALNYTWTSAGSMSCTNCSSTMVNPAAPTKYYVQGESAFGCKAIDSVSVDVQQRFVIGANLGDTLCTGEKLRLQANGADLYTWSPSAGLDNTSISNPVAQPSNTTVYQVVGRDKNNCFTDTAWVPVTVYPYPKIDMEKDKTVVVGTSVPLKPVLSTDITHLSWMPATWLSCSNCPSPVAAPKQTTQYRLRATNEGGCTTERAITLFVVCNGENIFLPNTFSPNGDGMNDVFYPQSKGLSYIKNFRIFNRWGEVVFEQLSFQANDPSKGWNGKHKNAPAVDDVLVYIIEVVCENGETLTFKGDVTIIR
jgi:gliding motility-associated-like protein